MLAETYTELMTDRAHLMFEITLTVIQDVGIGLIAWPLIKRAVRKHDNKKHSKKDHCEPDCCEQEELFDENDYSRKSTPVEDERPHVGGPGWNERRLKRLGRKGY